MGIAAVGFLALSLVVAVYLWNSAPSASRADERRRWWSFTHGADPNPFGARGQAGPGDDKNLDSSDGICGTSGP
jgi:hypothetical protein